MLKMTMMQVCFTFADLCIVVGHFPDTFSSFLMLIAYSSQTLFYVGNASDPDFSPEQPSDDMLQMALMGTGFDEPSADFEGTVTASASQSARSRAAEIKDGMSVTTLLNP